MRWFVALTIVASVPSMAASCPTIGGIDAIMRPGALLVFEELYGTAESPAFVVDVACHATAADLPVVVGIQLPSGESTRIDTFLDSEGAPQDREALVAGPAWQAERQDGRSSFAILELIDGLRRLRAAGGSVLVVTMDAVDATDGTARDQERGRAIAAAAKASPDALLIVLTGNRYRGSTHGIVESGQRTGRVLAELVPDRDVITLDAAHGPGSAWQCPSDCGPVEILGSEGNWRWTIAIDETIDPARHRGRYHIGGVSASPPARGGVATVPVDATPWVRRRTSWTPDDWSPPPASPRRTGDLTVGEQLFQGTWQAYDHDGRKPTWSIRIAGRDFRAEGGGQPGEFYAGYVSIRGDTSPKQIDFTIEDCDCDYQGATSRGLYYEDESSIVLASPPPGARPAKDFEEKGHIMRIRRVDGSSEAKRADSR